MDEIERKDLISRIEHGEYVTYEMPKYAVSKDVVFLIVLGIIYPAMLAVEAMMRHINLDAEIMLNVERVRSIYPHRRPDSFCPCCHYSTCSTC